MAAIFSPAILGSPGGSTGLAGGDTGYSEGSSGQLLSGDGGRYGLVLDPSTGYYELKVVDGVAPMFDGIHGSGFVFQPTAGTVAGMPLPGFEGADGPSSFVGPAISDPIADVLNGPHGGAAPAIFNPAAEDAARPLLVVKSAIGV